jgi:hypothetical protein
MNVDDRFPDPVDITEQVEILRSGPSFRGPYSYLLRGLYLGDSISETRFGSHHVPSLRYSRCSQVAIKVPNMIENAGVEAMRRVCTPYINCFVAEAMIIESSPRRSNLGEAAASQYPPNSWLHRERDHWALWWIYLPSMLMSLPRVAIP